MAVTMTPDGQIQVLLWFVDTNQTKDIDVLWASMKPHVAEIKFEKAAWLAALEYAEERIELVEKERNAMLERVRSISRLWGRYKDVGSGLQLTKSRLREKASVELGGAKAEGVGVGVVIEAAKVAIVALCRVREEREMTERRLAKDLQDAVAKPAGG
ncbi:hypothetical protein LTR36_010731 [Oleoguttula mirabilis]|uniref:Uncharacterized protein n=1 Tax=Oleoguttula mirabilis TaxID=1507867 RepID=A0AAV9JS01_9PEZI|nr:hypothetical protein LTR36_010731 [Oleoguttula mirabilis]